MKKLTYEGMLARASEAPSEKSKYPISVGKEILEPTEGLAFTVVNDDVVGSVVADKESCAAAKALCRLPDIDHAWVFRTRTLIRRSSGAIERYENPRGLQRAVEGFDDSAGLFPAGEYQLKPLTPSDRKEAKKEWNEKNKHRRGGRRPYEYVAPPKPLRKK